MQGELRDGGQVKWLSGIERCDYLALDKAYPGLDQAGAPLALVLNGGQICSLQSSLLEGLT